MTKLAKMIVFTDQEFESFGITKDCSGTRWAFDVEERALKLVCETEKDIARMLDAMPEEDREKLAKTRPTPPTATEGR